MHRACGVLLAAAITLGGCATVDETPLAPAGTDQYFSVESQLARSRRGEPIVSGYIHNSYALPAMNVRVMVEGVDGQGKVVSRTTAYVLGEVPGNNRAYFEVTVPGDAQQYRVIVFWWEWKGRGSS